MNSFLSFVILLANKILNTSDPEQLLSLDGISLGFAYKLSMDCVINIQAEFCSSERCELVHLPPLFSVAELNGIFVRALYWLKICMYTTRFIFI